MGFVPDYDDRFEAVATLVNTDRERGLAELRTIAETGTQWAILSLGLYLSEQDETTDEAIKWLKRADQFGAEDAAWNLAMFARQHGDTHEMKRWIDRAATLGQEDALVLQANGYDVAKVLASW